MRTLFVVLLVLLAVGFAFAFVLGALSA